MAGFVERLGDLMRSGENLPTLPETVLRLHGMLDNELVDLGTIAGVIERDPPLAARLLRVANSAYYFRGGDAVGSVPVALQRLGMGQVRVLCLALGVVSAFGKGCGGFDYRAFWSHSGAVGMVAHRLWQSGTRDPGMSADDLYAAGLLHDIGLLVLDQFFTQELLAVRAAAEAASRPLWREEEDQLGMDHGEVGALLLGRWSLPATTCAAVGHHHHPDTLAESNRRGALCLHAAEALVHGIELGLPLEGPADLDARDALAAAGVPWESRVAVGTALDQVRQAASQFIAPE